MFGLASITALRTAMTLLRNPVVLAAIGIVAVGLYGSWKGHKARVACNATWEHKLATERLKFASRVEKANQEAASREARDKEELDRLRKEAEKIKEALGNAPSDCRLSDDLLERLRRFK